MKQIYANVTQETYNELFRIARKEEKNISTVIQEILAKETNTKCIIFNNENKMENSDK